MAIRFEDIKPAVGSRVVWDERADIFTPEAAEQLRVKLAELGIAGTPPVFPDTPATGTIQWSSGIRASIHGFTAVSWVAISPAI